MICSRQTQEYARSRTHFVSEMQQAIDDILQRFVIS
ncbi:MAG: hypothetical protein IJS39_03955 [Synergistaceae bacterium]|nr:hypothetical protein [Synergistaceae bacterium]